MEAVGARQVEHRVVLARRRVEAAFLALDGDAGVIGDFLPAAGEQVEQRGLAAIRVADQGQADGVDGAHAVGSAPAASAPHVHARRFAAAQREPGVADLHQQRLGADRSGGQHLDPLATDEAELAQAARDGVVGRVVFDGLDRGGGAARQFGQLQGLTSATSGHVAGTAAKWELFSF